MLACAAGGRPADAGGLVLLTLQPKFSIGFLFFWIHDKNARPWIQSVSSFSRVPECWNQNASPPSCISCGAPNWGPPECEGTVLKGGDWPEIGVHAGRMGISRNGIPFFTGSASAFLRHVLSQRSLRLSGCWFGLMSFYDSQHDTCAQREDRSLNCIVYILAVINSLAAALLCSMFLNAVIKYLIKQCSF